MKKINNNHIVQFVLVVVCAIFLFYQGFNSFQIRNINRINAINESDNTSKKTVSSQELFNESWSLIKNNYYKRDFNKQDWSKWKRRYRNKIKTPQDAQVAIDTMLASLNDPYSKFLTSEKYEEQNNAINSKIYGIGINITSLAGKIYIVNVIKGTPADSQGLLPGDIILKINDTDVSGQSVYQVARLIKSDEDSVLDMELLRGNEKYSKSIKREEIKIKTVEYKNITDDIGYIRVSSFIGLDTTKEFVVALNKLKDTKALILDLRGNSGGLFQNSVIISNLFIKNGTIVQVIARRNKNIYKAESEGCIYENPLVILIDENTASASEILAGSLRDNNRAVLAGTKSFGKGLVQKIYSLPNNTGINITIAKYLTPKGSDIDELGIEPDYYVTIAHNDFINNIDSQLVWAKTYLEKEIENK